MASVGGGWLWPNITIRSEGMRILLDAAASRAVDTEPLRYLTTERTAVPAEAFEEGVDDFVQGILDRLDRWSLSTTDLRTAWSELAAERQDPECARYRKIEALLGSDVDEADSKRIGQVIEDGRVLGNEAMAEVVAGRPLTAADLREAARASGIDANPGSGAGPADVSPVRFGTEAPWRIGTDAARSFRQREGLGDAPVSDSRLADLYGVGKQALSDAYSREQIAFALRDACPAGDRIVLRSKWRVGRRFDLARLLADRLLVAGNDENLRPATRAHTCRQKMQRAFAAELLCPLAGLQEFMHDDVSEGTAEAAADRYGVSSLAVTQILQNYGLLDWKIQNPELRP